VNGRTDLGALDWVAFTFPFNLTGQPAATINCGFTADGLPVGLQIVGRRNEVILTPGGGGSNNKWHMFTVAPVTTDQTNIQIYDPGPYYSGTTPLAGFIFVNLRKVLAPALKTTWTAAAVANSKHNIYECSY